MFYSNEYECYCLKYGYRVGCMCFHAYALHVYDGRAGLIDADHRVHSCASPLGSVSRETGVCVCARMYAMAAHFKQCTRLSFRPLLLLCVLFYTSVTSQQAAFEQE